MVKIHTKAKRKLGLTTSQQHRAFFKGIKKVNRPKTFKTEEAAKRYATSKGIEKYTLVNLRSPEATVKKIKIVVL